MVKRVLLFYCVIQLVGLDTFAQSDDMFSIFLVRHSEKEQMSDDSFDLPLSKCGKQRSVALSSFLSEVHLDVVYSTDFTRTKHTALPTADKKGIEISLYNDQDIRSFSTHLIENRQNALVVGHSNTTGVLAGLLANQKVEDIELHIYDYIYQVVFFGESRVLNLFHSNFECVQ